MDQTNEQVGGAGDCSNTEDGESMSDQETRDLVAVRNAGFTMGEQGATVTFDLCNTADQPLAFKVSHAKVLTAGSWSTGDISGRNSSGALGPGDIIQSHVFIRKHLLPVVIYLKVCLLSNYLKFPWDVYEMIVPLPNQHPQPTVKKTAKLLLEKHRRGRAKNSVTNRGNFVEVEYDDQDSSSTENDTQESESKREPANTDENEIAPNEPKIPAVKTNANSNTKRSVQEGEERRLRASVADVLDRMAQLLRSEAPFEVGNLRTASSSHSHIAESDLMQTVIELAVQHAKRDILL